MRKGLVITLVCLLTLYAPLELSRVIIVYCLKPSTIFELCFLWVFYLGAIIFLTKVVKV